MSPHLYDGGIVGVGGKVKIRTDFSSLRRGRGKKVRERGGDRGRGDCVSATGHSECHLQGICSGDTLGSLDRQVFWSGTAKDFSYWAVSGERCKKRIWVTEGVQELKGGPSFQTASSDKIYQVSSSDDSHHDISTARPDKALDQTSSEDRCIVDSGPTSLLESPGCVSNV